MSIVAPSFVRDSVDWTTVFFQRVTSNGIPSRANSAFEFLSDYNSTADSVEYVQNEFAPNGEYGFGKVGSMLNLWMRYLGNHSHGGVAIIVGYLPTDNYLNSSMLHTGIYSKINIPYLGDPNSAIGYFECTGGTTIGAKSYSFDYPYSGFNPGVDKSLVNRPQFRAMTMVKSAMGDCAFGAGHPDYTSTDSRVWTYTDCGKIDYYNEAIQSRQDKTIVVRSTNTGLLVSFIEIKVQGGYSAAEFDFSYPGEYAEPETPWWGQKRHVTESATRGRILDRRGFPI